jgi:acyl-homoserine-lactone acylase
MLFTRSLLLLATLVVAQAQPVASSNAKYAASIKRTSYGVAHITAKDFGSLGFGEGYAQAEDHLCTIADQVVKARGERSKYFGAGKSNEHLSNDITMKALGMSERGSAYLAKQPKEIQDWYAGFAAGYNKFLSVTPKDKYPGWCAGTDWVHPISAQDMSAYQQVVLLVTTNFAPMIASAAPPAAVTPSATPTAGSNEEVDLATIDLPKPDWASNGWAIGKDLAAEKGGMLIANPHYPWVGSNRFWEKHLVVPGKLNVYGVSLIGNIGVSIGFNKDVAWTHTVSAGKRFTAFALDLVPGKPTAYRYGNSEREMTRKQVSVEVRQADGSLKTVQRDVWFSHYGPLVNIPGLGWSPRRAVSVRDANADNNGAAAQWFDMSRATSMKEFQAAHEKHQGMPWVNTIAASRDGLAWYADTASTPNLSTEALEMWQERLKTDAVVKRFDLQGIVLLNGSDPKFEWAGDSTSTKPGVVGYANTPRLERADYVFNANDSFWIANSHAPLTGAFSPLHGEQNTVRSLRTRNNDLTLSNLSPDKPAGSDGRFTLDEMANALLSNRSLAAELLKDRLVEVCEETSLGEPCKVLKAWNGRYDVDSRGAALFREFLMQYSQADYLGKGRLYAVDFDPRNPTNTPRELGDTKVAVENLRKAVKLLQSRNIALDTPLGELQYADKAGRRMPVHGGDGFTDGLMNMQRNSRNATTLEPMDEPKAVAGSRSLTEKGYPVVHGSSFILALEFTGKGPRAKAFLTYSQSGDPKSPHFADQTELFAKKQWRPVLFGQKAINSDAKRTYKVGN